MQFDQLKRRRELIMMLGGMAASSVACPFAVHAQRGERMRHVGLREGHTSNDPVVKMKIDRFVSGEMSRQKIPGMAIAVVKNGEAVVAKGYGFANLEDQVPVTTHSIFQSGSVGKQFTAAAIVHLEEHGKLRLDDNIARYLPPTKARWGSITVRQLLTHTSGIPDYER
jgi:CubicO group peptidase (beta-lactamase class C family)